MLTARKRHVIFTQHDDHMGSSSLFYLNHRAEQAKANDRQFWACVYGTKYTISWGSHVCM
jgi:hypothetical protein